MEDLVKCPHCNGRGKVPSSEALRAEADTLMRDAFKHARNARKGREAHEAIDRLEEKMERVEEIRYELRRRADHALRSN